ncbi:MAG: NAD(P)-dependent oxidoreductase [Candidatus Omnitrophica bacterium]|nr:NAD(P)-dependent oxidoreductase [Candidatus Omnitrophota bacterium]
MLKNKKILITGATGFIGSNLTRYFLKKCAGVSVFTRMVSDKWRIRDILKDVYEYHVDLNDPVKLEKAVRKIRPNIIIHTASHGGHSFQNNAKKIIEANFTGTVNLISALKDTEVDLLINTGSSSEYGIKSRPMKEIDLLEPVTEYGATKAAASAYCHGMAGKENIPVVTARLFSPYGYYDEGSRLISYVILSCLGSRNPKLSSTDPVRDFIFIEDVMDAYEKIIDNRDRVKGEIFNIGSGKQHTVGEVVKNIVKLTGSMVKPEWGRVNNSRCEPERWQADISKARRILKWEPEHSLSRGLKKDIIWFKENIRLYK